MRNQTPTNDIAEIDLRIIATTDLHMQLGGQDRPGMTRIAGAVRQTRCGHPNTLLFDNGDTLQGGADADHFACPSVDWPGSTHPIYQAMNALGYDGAALGNHDFDFGLDMLDRALTGANFPIFCANVDLGDRRVRFRKRQIIHRHVTTRTGCKISLAIGVTGLTAPGTVADNWARFPLDSRETEFAQTAIEQAQKLRQDGADVVIGLCHIGLAPDGAIPAQIQDIAESGQFDTLILGHTHQLFPAPRRTPGESSDATSGLVSNTPTVLPGSHAGHIGIIDLRLTDQGSGWRVTQSNVALCPTASIDEDCPTKALLAPARAAAKAGLATQIGSSLSALHDYFSHLGPSPVIRFVAAAKFHWARQVLPEIVLPILSADTPYLAGGSNGPHNYCYVPAGPVRRADLWRFSPFPNLLVPVVLTGAQIALWLENASGKFAQIDRTQTELQPLLDPELPSYRFVDISGLDYDLDLSAPANSGLRIGTIQHDGRAIDPTDRLLC